MRKLNFGGCIVSGFSAGCLTLVIIILGVVYIIKDNKLDTKQPINEIEEETTHLNSQDKPIKYKIGLIADTENDWITFERATEVLNENKVDYVFHLGDATHLGVKEDILHSKEILDTLNMPYSIVPGDRDLWKSDGTSNFTQVFGEHYKVIDVKGDKFLLIDNADEYRGIDSVQQEFIQNNLPESDFILLHNPLFKNDTILGYKVMGQYSEEINKQRENLLESVRNSTVNAVFAGDQHIFNENVDDKDDSLMHYIIGALNKDRSLAPMISILTVYDDGDFYVEKLIVH